MSKHEKRAKRSREEATTQDTSASSQTSVPIHNPPSPDFIISNPLFSQSQQFQPGSLPAGFISSSIHTESSLSTDTRAQSTSGKIAIPKLRASKTTESSSKSLKKGRIPHACDNCRKAKSSCTGEQPCLRCSSSRLPCVYGDNKRDKNRKQLSKLNRKANVLYQQNLEITEALKRIQLDTDLSKEGMRVAIDEVLSMTHPESREIDFPNPTQGGHSEEPDDLQDRDEQDDVEDRGSTGSHDVIDVDIDRDEARPTGHMGKSSSVAWAKRTAEECRYTDGQEPSAGIQYPDLVPPSYHAEDADFEYLDVSNINMYERPESKLAEALLQSYFDHVHPVFPILEKESFKFKYNNFRQGSSDASPEDLIWLGTLNIIFAIMSYYAQLVASPHHGLYHDHLIYCARAKMLCMDQRLLYQDARISTTRALGLLCLYYIGTCRLNRAWTISGIAIRNALTLGLHVRSEAMEIPDIEKEHRIRLWWSLYSLECLLNTLTGRPSCIADRDIGTPLPINMNESDFHLNQTLYNNATDGGLLDSMSSSQGSHSQNGRSVATSQISSSTSHSSYLFAMRKLPLTSSTYFIYRTQLWIISHNIVSQLYCASAIRERWTAIQGTIRRIDQRLLAWQQTLPEEFNVDFNTYSPPDWNDPFLLARTGLAMLFNSSRMVLFRPCLCRFEGRTNQTEETRKFNQDGVETCIRSARRMMSLLSWSAVSTDKLYAILPWWSTIHYICEALAVLMLEMALRSQHMPTESAFIFDDAKLGISWLAMMSSQSISARKAWEVFDKLIRRVAPLINWSVFDIPTEAPIPPGYNWRRPNIAHPIFHPRPPQTQVDQLPRANLQQYEHTLHPISHLDATSAWTAQPSSFQPFRNGRSFPNQPYSSSKQLEHLGNPLDHMEALNRFSAIGNIHGHYDDPWMHMFYPEEQDHAQGMYETQQYRTGIDEGYGAGAGMTYHDFGNLNGNENIEQVHYLTKSPPGQFGQQEGRCDEQDHEQPGIYGGIGEERIFHFGKQDTEHRQPQQQESYQDASLSSWITS